MDIKVLDNINHNGKSYKPGDIMRKVTKKDAERLINLGAAEETEETSDVDASDEYDDLEDESSNEDAKKNK
ncbi:hypothetical protein [Clostridium cylindrosporum]|uniref:DUF7210 domain-containing protein n=1 Tax=Clostridium cylindrosporum DSM 605 TaxID=1121307 RepID=A0A0J8DFR9_CLOCY|nr:hypothetical protein [Clostridium cylindrosporum]KMT23003.1 hypothetical protein CLCY_7c00500 [Clostridium cylindrosporum DSM 605]